MILPPEIEVEFKDILERLKKLSANTAQDNNQDLHYALQFAVRELQDVIDMPGAWDTSAGSCGWYNDDEEYYRKVHEANGVNKDTYR